MLYPFLYQTNPRTLGVNNLSNRNRDVQSIISEYNNMRHQEESYAPCDFSSPNPYSKVGYFANWRKAFRNVPYKDFLNNSVVRAQHDNWMNYCCVSSSASQHDENRNSHLKYYAYNREQSPIKKHWKKNNEDDNEFKPAFNAFLKYFYKARKDNLADTQLYETCCRKQKRLVVSSIENPYAAEDKGNVKEKEKEKGKGRETETKTKKVSQGPKTITKYFTVPNRILPLDSIELLRDSIQINKQHLKLKRESLARKIMSFAGKDEDTNFEKGISNGKESPLETEKKSEHTRNQSKNSSRRSLNESKKSSKSRLSRTSMQPNDISDIYSVLFSDTQIDIPSNQGKLRSRKRSASPVRSNKQKRKDKKEHKVMKSLPLMMHLSSSEVSTESRRKSQVFMTPTHVPIKKNYDASDKSYFPHIPPVPPSLSLSLTPSWLDQKSLYSRQSLEKRKLAAALEKGPETGNLKDVDKENSAIVQNFETETTSEDRGVQGKKMGGDEEKLKSMEALEFIVNFEKYARKTIAAADGKQIDVKVVKEKEREKRKEKRDDFQKNFKAQFLLQHKEKQKGKKTKSKKKKAIEKKAKDKEENHCYICELIDRKKNEKDPPYITDMLKKKQIQDLKYYYCSKVQNEITPPPRPAPASSSLPAKSNSTHTNYDARKLLLRCYNILHYFNLMVEEKIYKRNGFWQINSF